MTDNFTLAGYRALIEAFLERGYEACSFAKAEPEARHLVLRHDLDMSLDAALPIAEIENQLGVSGSYFFLLRTEMYNPHSRAGIAVLQRLCELGHEVGLHLDASLYPDNEQALEAAATNECMAAEPILGRQVETISFHRPAQRLLDFDQPLAGRRHTYQSRFFRQMGYCSDSRGDWHHGHPLDHEAVSNGRALQLLTHPIWWSHENAHPVQDTLEQFAHERYQLLRQELGHNCEAFDPTLPAPTTGRGH